MRNILVKIEILLLILVSLVLFESCIMDSDEDIRTAGAAITFDDVKYLEDWLSVIDTLTKKYDFRATFFIDHFDLLNDQQIGKLQLLRDLGSEIGYHGLRHRDAVEYCKNYSIAQYIENEIVPGLRDMQQKGFSPSCFAYPLGSRKKNIDKALLNYFKILRGTYADRITKPPASYYYDNQDSTCVLTALKIDSDSPYAMSELYKGFKYALQYNCVVILYGHGASETIMPMYIPVSRLETICSFAVKHKMKFYTLSELGKN